MNYSQNSIILITKNFENTQHLNLTWAEKEEKKNINFAFLY